MKRLFIVLMIASIAACKSQTGKTNEQDSAVTTVNTNNIETRPVEETTNDISGCYMQVLKRDTFAVILKQNKNSITGRLTLDNYEKDGSTGSVSGKMDADILKLVYTFNSEGMKSIMEVNFKYKDNTLIRGIGEMSVIGDSAFFTDPAAVKYNGSVLTRMSCENLPGKYK